MISVQKTTLLHLNRPRFRWLQVVLELGWFPQLANYSPFRLHLVLIVDYKKLIHFFGVGVDYCVNKPAAEAEAEGKWQKQKVSCLGQRSSNSHRSLSGIYGAN